MSRARAFLAAVLIYSADAIFPGGLVGCGNVIHWSARAARMAPLPDSFYWRARACGRLLPIVKLAGLAWWLLS